MTLTGTIIESSIVDGSLCFKVRQDDTHQVWVFSNITFVHPISLIIDKQGRIIRKLDGTRLDKSPNSIISNRITLNVDVTKKPGISLMDYQDYIGLNLSFILN